MNEKDSDLLGACLRILQDFAETPCVVCGDTGYTLPCLRCDKPVCPDHRDDLDYCEEHRST
jgi:hypothetical protein